MKGDSLLRERRESYQLIKELFPAEWLPIKRTLIFFRGASSRRPSFLLIVFSPAQKIRKNTERQLQWGLRSIFTGKLYCFISVLVKNCFSHNCWYMYGMLATHYPALSELSTFFFIVLLHLLLHGESLKTNWTPSSSDPGFNTVVLPAHSLSQTWLKCFSNHDQSQEPIEWGLTNLPSMGERCWFDHLMEWFRS